ncbi:MAG TPA: hypothetical protein VK789_08430 [Bryobacteraceae bacterium]|nr:hypothetical protein [Bryobacteraceae bacterium]
MEDAIAALLTHRSIEEAAKAAGIGTQTLMRWMKLPEFESQYRKARRMVFRQSTARLQQASGAAATTLAKVMIDPATPPAVKVRAAECILNHGLKAIEVEDIDARVTDLEQASQQPKESDWNR